MKHIKNILYPLIVAILITELILKKISFDFLTTVFDTNSPWLYILTLLLSLLIVIRGIELIEHNYFLLRWETLTLFCGLALSLFYLSVEFPFNLISYYGFPIIGIPLILIILFVIILITQNISTHLNHNKVNLNLGFDYEKPIDPQNPSEDTFNRSSFAVNLSKKLIHSDFSHGSFAVGIVGNWGSGKTSLMVIMEHELEKHDPILINFNPWLSNSKNEIINDFFEALAHELDSRSSSLIKANLSVYAQKLAGKNNLFPSLLNLWLIKKSATSLYGNINDSINEIGKKVFVFIDDLDRLEENEILAVFKLIRNTANFSNVVFIVSYDREYISNHFQKNKNISQYIKKIINVEIPIPTLTKYNFRNHVIKAIEDFFDDKEERETLLIHYYPYDASIYEIVKNNRDLIKFINNLKLIYPLLKNRVASAKIFLLELLKLEDPSLFIELYENSKEDHSSKIIKLNTQYLDENRFPEKIKHLFELIFNPLDRNRNYQAHICITIPTTFDFYFSTIMPDYAIDPGLIYDFRRNNDFNSCVLKIHEWIEANQINDVIRLFGNIESYDSKEDFNFIILILIEIGEYQSSKIDDPITLIPTEDFFDVSRLLFQKLHTESENLKFYKTKAQLSAYLYELLGTDFYRFKYMFKPFLLNHLKHLSDQYEKDLKNTSFKTILTETQLEKLQLLYFEEGKKQQFDQTQFFMLLNFSYIKKDITGNVDLKIKLGIEFKNYFKNKVDSNFFKLLIREHKDVTDVYSLSFNLVRLFNEELNNEKFAKLILSEINVDYAKTNEGKEIIDFLNQVIKIHPNNNQIRYRKFKSFKPSYYF